ncbi:hypothetical protein QL285_076649 [Trifolium repens]|nr:hypothetical protein QL285_076649 [Trifolium repens]
MQIITNLNNASKAAARSLWIRTHSRHLECELLLDDRLVHLSDRSQVFGAVAGDGVIKFLAPLRWKIFSRFISSDCLACKELSSWHDSTHRAAMECCISLN